MAETFSIQAKNDRILSQRSFYYLCKEVLGYKDMVPHVHGDMCEFATSPRYGRFRQACIPRSWFKTWLLTIAKAIWLTLPDEESLYQEIYPYKGPNCRILIASNVIDNAAKMINKIKSEWMTNTRLQAAFPELVPEFNKVRWSDHCAELKRPGNYTEGSYTAVGVGGSVISQHFDHIIEDDLVYAKKDDFTGQELMPSQEDIDNAIGWHKLTFSLLSDPQHGCIDNVGTRWAPYDLVNHIRKNETQYSCFEITATRGAIWPPESDDDCLWPERYDVKTLHNIRQAQGPKIFETQYLNRPRAGEDTTFNIAYLNKHDSFSDFPLNLKYYTIVDLASWGDSKRIARNVVLTGAKDHRNHLWIARVDCGKFNPSEVIEVFKDHRKQFKSKVMVEEIQYQRAIRHFARLDMEKPGEEFYTIEALPYDGRKDAKNLRITALEPVVKNGALHVLSSMKEFITEMEDYPYAITKDILDCTGYLLRYAARSEPPSVEHSEHLETIEDLEREFKRRGKSTIYPFSNPLIAKEGQPWPR